MKIDLVGGGVLITIILIIAKVWGNLDISWLMFFLPIIIVTILIIIILIVLWIYYHYNY